MNNLLLDLHVCSHFRQYLYKCGLIVHFSKLKTLFEIPSDALIFFFRVLVFSQGKGGLVGHNNPMGLSSLGSKSPNLQSPPNVSVSKDLIHTGGMHPQLMPNTSHPNQLHSTMPMSSIQGGMNVANVGGNMIVTNSNMGGAGMLGSGIINNVNKQLPTLMGSNHHGGPQHHPHAQVSLRLKHTMLFCK